MKINEFLADPAANISGDANGDGTRDATRDEFIELVNDTGNSLDISGWVLADGFSDRHIFPNGTIVPAGRAIVVFGGGSPTGNFGGAIVQTASTGGLGLNNSGDTIILKDRSGGVIDTHTYGSEGGNDRSLSRNPDLSGSFEQHTTATGSASSLFSPGTKLDGAPFSSALSSITPIYDIQGMGHISPFNGQSVTTRGIVTAVASNGFYLQDAAGDGSDATSDAIFSFTRGSPSVNVGDRIEAIGTVSEFTPGGTNTGNLSITQLSSPSITILSTGNPLPNATIIGNEGRTPITQNIDDDNLTSFDPNGDGIDFYESLEGMWVQVNNAVAVSPTSRFGEIAILADNGAGAGLRTSREGIIIQPDDFNPERIIIDDGLVSNEPSVNVGDRFNAPIQGVFSYSFGNYKLLNTNPLAGVTSGNLQAETTSLTSENDALTVASFNVENLDPGDPDSKFNQLAQQIVNNLASPDIIGLQEIQDNNGTADDGTIAANQTYEKLINAIAAAGGATYEYRQIDPVNNADGGAPGSNIRVGFLFNPTRVEFSDRGTASPTDSTAINFNDVLTLSPGRVEPQNPAFAENSSLGFQASRKSLAGEFVFNGERIFIVNNHLKSKRGDTPLFGTTQPADLVTETQRIAQATVIKDFTDSILSQDPNANIIVLGDLNDFQFSQAVQPLGGNLTNLINTLTPAERYTYNFEGNSQSLDHILVSDNLKTRAEVDVVHLNSEFSHDSRSSDHDPIVSRFNFSPSMDYTLQILHTADQEGGLPAIQDAVNFSAVMNALDDDFANTLKLSSGDIYLPGPFFNASNDVYGTAGIGDILINNALGFQAVAFGNHEFDRGTSAIADLLQADPSMTGPGITGGYQGTEFAYLSANLDFSSDDNLKDLVVTDGGAPQNNSIAKSVVIDVNGENIGVVGATTPALVSISSPGDVGVLPDSSTDFNALAAIIQAEVDKLTATGIDKVVLLSHMQQIGIEKELARLLEDVDVIMAGGSNTLLANPDDPLRAGDTATDVYPLDLTSRNGERVVVINTDGNYQYVGRLAVDFDTNGLISNIRDESGAYATDDTGVDRVYGMDVNPEDVADPIIVEVTDAIADVVLDKDGNIFGSSEVFLNGTRGDVRTQETNLGNLTADANLFIAKQYDSEVLVSIKNGGGIRDNIGVSRIPAGGTSDDLELLPTEANPLVGKEAGDISQLDIENSLRFNNGLSLITVTADELKNILEYAVSATEDGATPGQFPQIGGLRFSFDPDEQAIELDDDGNVLTKGRRIRNAAIVDERGNIIDIISRNGQRVGNPNREIRLVTLNFLAGGGDGYPFDDYGEDKMDLVGMAVPAGGVDVANFTDDGSEQDALAEYLAAKFDDRPFRGADTAPQFDRRIQNLDFRNDTIFGIDKPQPKPKTRRNLERNNRNIFTVGGDRPQVTLRLSLTEINVSLAVNEIGVVKVDDDEGSIVGIKRGEAGYVEAALSRGKTVFSALPDAIFESFNATRVLEFAESDRLLFYMVQNSSTDLVLRDIKAGNSPPAVLFANGGNSVQINEESGDLFSLVWDDGLSGSVTMRLEYAPNASMPLGIGLQGDNERELIDLRGMGMRSATITVRSEAAYSNTVGLYAIDDETGAIDGLNPGDAGYAEAAIARRVTQFGTNGTAANIEGLLAPFIIANATVEEFLDRNPDNLRTGSVFAYFPYLGANPDGFDHLRLLGDNLFGFEDLAGGGDADFDDMVFEVAIA